MGGEEEPLVLWVENPLEGGKLCDICVKPSQTVGQAKHWVALRCPGVWADKIQVAREKPSHKTHGMGLRNFPAEWMYRNSLRIDETPWKDGDEFVYLYVGDVE